MIIMHILLLILSQRIKSRLINLILGVIYRPFELEIFLNDGLLRPKTMPEKLLNCSKPNELSKSPKTTFLALRMVKSRLPILAKVSIFGCISEK